jgi:hypothetical protein
MRFAVIITVRCLSLLNKIALFSCCHTLLKCSLNSLRLNFSDFVTLHCSVIKTNWILIVMFAMIQISMALPILEAISELLAAPTAITDCLGD